MASRYWVGGTSTWDTTVGTKWATVSGGIGGASVPTSADDVFFDANSGPVTVTVKGVTPSAPVVRSLDCTGFTGTFVGTFGSPFPYDPTITVSVSVVLSALMNWSSGPSISNTVGADLTIKSNGLQIGCPSGLNFPILVNNRGSIKILDDLVISTGQGIGIYVGTSSPTFDANNFNVTLPQIHFQLANPSGPATLINMGSGLWTFTGTGSLWVENGGPVTVTPGTSTIKITNTSATAKTFNGNGRSFHNLWVSGNAVTIVGNNTFADFRVDPNVTLKMTAGSGQTVTTANLNGSAGNLVRLQSSSAGSAWNLVCASGTITADWVYLQDSHASGGATFVANDATDGGNNTGWTIIGPISPAPKMFLTFSIAAALLGAALAAGGFGGGPIAFDRRRRGRARARPVFRRIYRQQDRRAA